MVSVNPVANLPDNLGGDLILRQFFAVLADVSDAKEALNVIAVAREEANQLINKANAELVNTQANAATSVAEAKLREDNAKRLNEAATAALLEADTAKHAAAKLLGQVTAQASSLEKETASVKQLAAEAIQLRAELISETAKAKTAKANADQAQQDAHAAEKLFNEKLTALRQQVDSAVR
jgi:hypothetical protein